MRRKYRQISPRAHEHVQPAGGKVRVGVLKLHRCFYCTPASQDVGKTLSLLPIRHFAAIETGSNMAAADPWPTDLDLCAAQTAR
jgi:hypothetical protein